MTKEPSDNNSKELSDESVSDILDMWKNELEIAPCVLRFHIDGKLIDIDLKPDKEFNCDNCKSHFCFKKMDWDDDQEFITSKKTGILTEMELLNAPAIIQFMDDYLKAYT